MLATQKLIDSLAARIERAYRLRRPEWNPFGSTDRVWSVSASMLLRANQKNPAYPADPELFVASQPNDLERVDPWVELTEAKSLANYRRHVRTITRSLRNELSSEVDQAERRIEAGEAIGKVLIGRASQISALASYITARRAGRPSLANRFLPGAIEQHQACPFYREASLPLLAPEQYPAATVRSTVPEPMLSLNDRQRSKVPWN